MGTARWRQTSFAEPLRPEWVSVTAGVTDFATLRTRSQDVVEAAAWTAVGERVLTLWPWLNELGAGGEPEPGDDGPYLAIFSGPVMFHGTPGRWIGGDGNPGASHRHHADPIWIVDALAGGAAVAEARSSRDTDPPGSRRAAFRLDIDEETGRRMSPGAQRVRTVGFRGEACVDRDGRLVAVQVTPIERRRARPRCLTAAGEPDVSYWSALELSEFGLPVSIEVPEAAPVETRAFPLEVLSIARDVRRAKRRYAKRADGVRGTA